MTEGVRVPITKIVASTSVGPTSPCPSCERPSRLTYIVGGDCLACSMRKAAARELGEGLWLVATDNAGRGLARWRRPPRPRILIAVARVLDRNGVQITRGVRVFKRSAGGRDVTYGTVVATVGGESVLVLWEGRDDDELVEARTIGTASAITEQRRRRR